MGTGCSQSSVGKCPPSDRLSSNCVIWQGESYPEFGICTGDPITEVTDVILKKLISFTEGEGITLEGLEVGCPELELRLKRTDYDLYQIVQLLLTENCRLDDLVKSIIDGTETSITIDVSCLTSETIRTREELDRLFVESICDTRGMVETLMGGLSTSDTSDIVSVIRTEVGNFLRDKLGSHNGIVEKTGSGSSLDINLIGIPLRGFVWGDFDLTKFDSSGKGTGIYTNFALANGQNGTVDMRGYVPSMATTISGVPRTFSVSQAPNSTVGEDKSKLRVSNLPNHQHVTNVNQTPHSHTWYEGAYFNNTYVQDVSSFTLGATPTTLLKFPAIGSPHTAHTTEDNVDISVEVTDTVGATSETFENRQPTRYVVCIQRIK